MYRFFGFDSFEQCRRGLIIGVLGNQLPSEGLFEDRLAKGNSDLA